MDKVDKLRKEIIESDTFCFYPFLELSTNPAGHVKPCCYYADTLKPELDSGVDDQFVISHGNTFEEVWNSNSLKDIRTKMHKGEKLSACDICYRDGIASMRQRSVNEYKNNREVLNRVSDILDNNGHSDKTPKRLELKPNNLCNLKCVMCNSYDSSQIAKELKALAKTHGGIEVNTGRFEKISDKPGIIENNKDFAGIDVPDWSDDENIWNSFCKILPGIETLSFAGGEPPLMPWVSKALQYAVDNGLSQNINVHVATNLTNIHQSFLDFMPHFKKFELIASIDGTEKVQEYCRFPSKWSALSTNYKKAKSYLSANNVKLTTNITVNLLNVLNLTDLLYWIEEQSTEYPYFKEWPYNINLLYFPEGQAVNNLSERNKILAIDRLEEYKKNSLILKEFPEIVHKIDLVIHEIQTPRNEKHFESFKNRIKVLDNFRKIDHKQYIPELDL
jgi:organic radical activating enzyme